MVSKSQRIKNEQLKEIKLIIPPDTNLPAALSERDWIVQQLGNNMGLSVSIYSSYEQVIASLETGGFDVLHFSTHGRYNANNPILSGIQLEKGIDLRPTDISGLARKFGNNKPMVILNACQTGAQGFSLTGIQSWATRFLDAGASVFIGTLWSVTDYAAFTFAHELYTQLSNGTTLGDAVRAARIKCKDNGDPSWLAYQLYGHPNSQIIFR